MKLAKHIISLAMAVVLSLSSLSMGALADTSNTENLGNSENLSARGLVFEGISEEVELWKRTDIILSSTQTYVNSYKDVEIQAVFTHESGKQLKIYGFWNGESEWRVRFSPTELGRWDYVVTSSNTADSGLHNITGSVMGIPNTGATDLDQHGFVKISENNRYFVHEDKTPFFWLGDTQWQAPNYVSTEMCNYPGCLCENQFKHEVSDRLDKGFNVYQTYFDIGENDGGGQLETTSEPSLWTVKHKEIDPSVFTEKIDYMFDHLAENGMTIALGYGVHSHTTNGMEKEDLLLASRYLTARYGSYPVIWITAQEINIIESAYNIWVEVAAQIDEMDPYNHPLSAHMLNRAYGQNWTVELDNEDWHDWWAVQGGHNDGALTKSYYQSYWDNTNSTKPFIETELNYEDVICGPFNRYESVCLGAWKAVLNGSFGFTYGATGIWANNYSTAGNIGWMPSFSYEPWYMGLEKQGSYDVKYMAEFFNYIDFSDLVPRFSDTAYSSFNGQEEKSLASTNDGSTFIAHFYNKNLATGTLYGLNDGEVYSAKWYNPVTGKFIVISDNITPVGGSYTIPKKLNKNDWVLLVTSRDFGAYETEQPYALPPSTEPENYALGVAASALSDNSAGGNHGPSSGVDGNYNTAWTASNDVMPQWYQIDMETNVNVKTVDMYLYRGDRGIPATDISFTIEGSLDNSSWSTLYTGTNEALTNLGSTDFIRVNTTGTCQYLRVVMDEINTSSGTSWATLVELEVYDTTEVTSPTTGGNLAIGSGVESSSASASANNVSKATDGVLNSYWCASSGNSPQWIKLNLGSAKSFQTAKLYMYGGTSTINYELKGSNDNNSWTTISSGTDVIMGSQGNNSYLEFSAVGNYQYIELVFNSVEGNWATVVEFELYDTIFSPPDDIIPTYSGVVQNPVVTSIGSAIYDAAENYSNTGANLFDGNKSTEWKPFAPIGSQAILMDLLAPNQLNGINITLGENAVLPEFRIDGSNNNKDWTVLLDTNLEKANALNNDGRVVISEALSGEYRYVKLIWLNASSNNAVKTISEIELYANNISQTHPTNPNPAELLTIYLEWKNENNSYGIQPASKWSALQKSLDEAATILMDLSKFEQADVDVADANLQRAISSLDSIDKSRLDSVILQAQTLNGQNYTFESWGRLTDELANSLKIFSASKVSQRTINLAVSALEKAIENLLMTGDEPMVSAESIRIKQSETQKVYVYLGKDAMAASNVAISCSDNAIASINLSSVSTSQNIVVTGKSAGNTTVTLGWSGGIKNGESTTIDVTVYDAKELVEVIFMDGNNIYAKRTAEAGEKILQWPDNPTKENHRFDGWFASLSNDNIEYTAETAITTSVVIHAKWTAVDEPVNPGEPSVPGLSSSQGGSGNRSKGSSVPDVKVYGNDSAKSGSVVTVDKAAAIKALNIAVAKAEMEKLNQIIVKFQNIGIFPLSVAKEMHTDTGKAITVQSDSLSPDGKRVDVRVIIDPSKMGKDTNLFASISSSDAKAVSGRFEKAFSKKVQVVVFGEQESFGQSVGVAVKLDRNLVGKNIVLYSYNEKTNTYKTIDSSYKIDANGYIRFNIAEGGIVVISDGSLK